MNVLVGGSYTYRPDPIIRRKKRVMRRFLFGSGGLVRRIVRRSLKKARKIRVSELDDDQAEAYREQMEDFQNGHRDNPPILRDIISTPGELPLLHTQPSPLKEKVVFAVDPDMAFVVIGPKRARDGVAGDIEKGQGDIKQARPFVGPGLEKALPRLPGFLKSAGRS